MHRGSSKTYIALVFAEGRDVKYFIFFKKLVLSDIVRLQPSSNLLLCLEVELNRAGKREVSEFRTVIF